MERRNQLGAAVVENTAAKAGNRVEGSQQRLRAELAERDDHFRPDHVDLLKQKGLAGGNLVRFGIAILRRPALDDVRDVDVLPRNLEALLDDVGEQLARAPDERDRKSVV